MYLDSNTNTLSIETCYIVTVVNKYVILATQNLKGSGVPNSQMGQMSIAVGKLLVCRIHKWDK